MTYKLIVRKKLKGLFFFGLITNRKIMNEIISHFLLIAWKCLPIKNSKMRKFEINQKNNKINKN